MKSILQLFILFIFTFLLSINTAHSQHTKKGKLLDKETQKSIAYGNLFFLQNSKGILSDEFGFFTLNLDSSYFNDTLKIYSLGYKSIYIAVSDIKNSHNFFLERETYDLPEIFVNAKDYETKKKGASKKSNATFRNCAKKNMQVALFIEGGEGEVIKTISFYISKKGIARTPFRVRLYDVDTISFKPNKNLLNESVIISGANPKSWIEVDIANYNIEIPKHGCFVAMEWLYVEGSNKYLMGKNRDIEQMCFGQSLGMTYEFDKNITWTKVSNGIDWKQSKRSHRKGKFLNAAISIEIIKRKQ